MEKIDELVDNVVDELHDAKKYMHLSLEYKETDPDLSRLYYDLSTGEMEHMGRLHKRAMEEMEKNR